MNGHLLFVAGRELTYSRNDVLLRTLRRNGWKVDSIGFQSPVRSILKASLQLSPAIVKTLLSRRYQLVVVGFYGYLLLPMVKMLARAPVLFDAFISNFDTICGDRQRVHPSSLLGKGIYWFDYWSYRLCDHLLLDTPCQIHYFLETFRLDPGRVSWLPVGCNEDIFQPSDFLRHSNNNETTVLHYSTYLPLHGVDIILHAAARLRTYPIRFRLIGDGPLYLSLKSLAHNLHLEQVDFLPPVSLANLAQEIARADICLGGHFGSSAKSQRVVPGKIYQMMASKRAVVAADSPANRSLIGNTQSALLIPPGDPDALAQAILRLHQEPALRLQLAEAAYRTYRETCSEDQIAAKLNEIISLLH